MGRTTQQEMSMIMLARAEWGATVATTPYLMRFPAVGVHVHHSVTIADDDYSLEATGDVAADMREIEAIGRARFGRFPYSYCIHPSGVIGEGAGLTVGAHTENWNSTTFGVCFVGNYEHDPLTDAQVVAFHELRAGLVANGWLTPDAWLLPHRHRKATACPGANVIARWVELEEGDHMNTTQEAKLDRVLGLLEDGLPAGSGRLGHAVLTTNHYVTTILAPQLAALAPNIDAQLDALAAAVQAVAATPPSGAPAPAVTEILDALAARLQA
jgi:hypothetical protein